MKTSSLFIKAPILLVVSALFLTHTALSIAWLLPDTGQRPYRSGAVGEDGNSLINPQSFTKLDADGKPLPDSAKSWAMVLDRNTGLTWEIKTMQKGLHYFRARYTWKESRDTFITTLNKEKFGGASDWRLPTIEELVSISHKGTYNPAINISYFPKTGSADFWSATPVAGDAEKVWRVQFANGMVGTSLTSSKCLARAVRGRTRSKSRLVDNGDGTVTDVTTGLMWQKKPGPLMTWEQALTHSRSLKIAGYNDWRLPNPHELQTLVDYAHRGPACDKDRLVVPELSDHPEKRIAAPEERPDLKPIYDQVPDHRLCFWSSTYDADNYQNAWLVDFNSGRFWVRRTDTINYTRTVRGGHFSGPDRISIQTPAQGSSWSVGKIMEIKWESAAGSNQVDIRLSRRGGKEGDFPESIAFNVPNNGHFSWLVSGELSDNCYLSISPSGNKVDHQSSIVGLFRIVPPVSSTSEKAQ